MIRRGAGPLDDLIDNQVVVGAPSRRRASSSAAGPWRRPSAPGPDHLRPGRHGRAARRGAGSARTRAARPGAVLRLAPRGGGAAGHRRWPGCCSRVGPVSAFGGRPRRGASGAAAATAYQEPAASTGGRAALSARGRRRHRLRGRRHHVRASSAKSAQAAWASVSGVNSHSA